MAEDNPVEEQDFWYDIEAAKKINGLFANRIYVQPLGDGMVRINFGEVLDHDSSYHSAIVVTAAQAKGFAQVIFNVATAVIDREYAPPNAPTVPTVTPPAVDAAAAQRAAYEKVARALAEGEGESGRGE